MTSRGTLPSVIDILDMLAESNLFSTLNLEFLQVVLDPEDKERAAFCMGFTSSNSFERFMEEELNILKYLIIM